MDVNQNISPLGPLNRDDPRNPAPKYKNSLKDLTSRQFSNAKILIFKIAS